MPKAQEIISFRGKYSYLSNFYHAPITYNGLTYLNNEAAFQAQKSIDSSEQEIFTMLSPSDAKKKGRHVRLRSDWENVKDKIMEDIVRAKFTQHTDLQGSLLETGTARLVEGNTWNDRYWGVDINSGIGKNRLGEILMKVRSELMDSSIHTKGETHDFNQKGSVC